jgi:hypothetical protein
MLSLSTLAQICEDVYSPAQANRPRAPSLRSWQRFDREHKNFFCSFYKGPIWGVFAIRGTEKSDSGDIGEDLVTWGLGMPLWSLSDCLGWCKAYMPYATNMLVCGHSLGGAYSQYVGALLGLQSITFNSPGLFTNMVGMLMMQGRGKNHLNFRHPQDIVSKVGKTLGPQYDLDMSFTLNLGAAHSMSNIVNALQWTSLAPEDFTGKSTFR